MDLKFEAAKRLLWGRLTTYHELESTLRQHGLATYLEPLMQTANTIPALEVTKGVITCNRCHNQRLVDFAELPSKNESLYYCLNCLNMGRVLQGEHLYFLADQRFSEPAWETSLLTWQGQLSVEQARAAADLISRLNDVEKPHSIIAVTGAGKTEMIYPVIEHVLLQAGRVAIASPRIDVCLELYPRLMSAFSQVEIKLLYGGNEEAYAYTSLVICTTHQLLRFNEAFDLLIVDEVDAFPYASDASLHYAVKRAVKKLGKLVYLTATPDRTLRKAMKEGRMTSTLLPARFHGHPLPEPTFHWVGDWRQSIRQRQQKSKLWKLLVKFSQLAGVKLIFLPNIQLAELLYQWLNDSLTSIKLACVHSKDPLRKQKVQMVRDGEIELLISTTILERGVTFTNCQVCIVGAESHLFTRASLVQMSGRVGRKQDFPSGQLLYAHQGVSWAMKQAEKEIIGMNQTARKGGLVK